MRWFKDCKEAFFGGGTRAPRDYRSKRRWFAQRILPLIIGPVYAAFITPLEGLRNRLGRLTKAELSIVERAAREILGDNFLGLEHEIDYSPEDGSGMESVTIRVRERGRWTPDGPEDQIRDRAIALMPGIYDNHLVLWLREPEPVEN